jgi:hypothetical protein
VAARVSHPASATPADNAPAGQATCVILSRQPAASGANLYSAVTCAGADGKWYQTSVQWQVSPTDGIQVLTPDVSPGGSVTLWIASLKPGTTVAISLDGKPLTTLQALADGVVMEPVTIPAGTSLGAHQLRAVGVALDGSVFDHSTELQVVAPQLQVVAPQSEPQQSIGH